MLGTKKIRKQHDEFMKKATEEIQNIKITVADVLKRYVVEIDNLKQEVNSLKEKLNSLEKKQNIENNS